ncbi:serine/threonine protein phosphatase [Pseudohoeflea coraliihabitans]|uniref:Serine/threonine protein phosphatase n=1 Tax=Pseudohoeflea coraliihabitans TaxID=2860393 RepID=A0ABS6WP02_9HYPH|nr:serine/threonine protein phosphatase [Pseudohoeflea sp. DP4N28-3]MBW3097684.1 serine/threonine protein phosphatase [Pseudohoeflea sp. DP4N28-3]
MYEKTDIAGETLSPEAAATLEHLLAGRVEERISRADLAGHVVWIKRYDLGHNRLIKRSWARLSALMPVPAMRSSPPLDPAGSVHRETRKIHAFRQAGLGVPDVLFSNDETLVLSDAGRICERELMRLEAAGKEGAYDALLIRLASALGEVHRRGLCHGRPHPRDMFLAADDQIGFFDFEEEPEAVMPMRTAQARDVWLLFLQICTVARTPQTPGLAFDAYLVDQPDGILDELRRFLRFLSPLVPLLGPLEHRVLGKDAQRALRATRCLRDAVSQRNTAPRRPHGAQTGQAGEE